MKEQGYTKAIVIAVALVFILALVGSASAGNAVQLKIKGNGKLVDGARIFESDNDAVAERTLQVTLNGPGKLAYFDAGTVHANNTDGSIVADVDVTKIEVSGKSSGTGTVEANATVRAEGHNILDGNGNVIGINAESEIEAFVDLNAGAKGNAEGTAFAAGTATATGVLATGGSIGTSAEGTASAGGKVTSTNPSQLFAEGAIEGESTLYADGTMTDPVSSIDSYVRGFDASQGAASASGAASATATNADEVRIDTSAEGATSASGSSTKGGAFEAEAEIFADGVYYPPIDAAFLVGTDLMADMYTDAWAGSKTKTGKASASASASGEAATSAVFGKDLTPAFNAEVLKGSMVSSSASVSGMGEAFGDTEIEAWVTELGFPFVWTQDLPLDVPSGIGIQVIGDTLLDDSFINSEAGAFGDGTGFKGSAAASAVGSAESAGALADDGTEITDFSNSFAKGSTAAGASATGTGEAASGSVILSLDVIDGHGSFALFDEPIDAEMIPTQIFAEFELPESVLADASIIADFAYADGESKTDTAKACSSASGETGAEGALVEVMNIIEISADSYAAGSVNACASVGARADPFAASIIASTSIPAISGEGEPLEMVDASLIASLAESAGPKGAASASASGFTAANGTLEFALIDEEIALGSHTTAAGPTNAVVSSTDGFALSFANIGSANYENLEGDGGVVTDAELIDVSLIGGVSIADGKAKAASSATGVTGSDGMVVIVNATDVELVNITAHTEALSGGDTVATSVTSFGGYGVAAAGVGSVSVADWEAGITANLAPGVPPTATVVDVSLIGDFVLAEGDAPSDSATAVASANGVTGAIGNVHDTSFADLDFNVTGSSFAAGEVYGKAVGNAISDPISVSAILSVNVVDVENTVDTGLGIPSDSTIVDVSTITSASLANGKNGVAIGSAEGFADANGAVSMVDFMDNVTLISDTFAAGEAETRAATTADGSLAISLAGQTAVDVIVNNEEPVVVEGFTNPGITSFVLPEMPKLPVELPDEVNMLIGHGYEEFDRLGEAICTSGLLETDDKVCDEIGPFLQLLCDNREKMPVFTGAAESAGDPVVVGVSAAGSAVFSSGKGTASASTEGAAGTDGFMERVYGLNVNPEIESETFTGATSNADVRTFGGFGIGAAGAASVDVVTFEPDFTGGVPTATIVDVSVIGDAVFAAGATPKDTAKVTASADAFTEASGSVDTFVIGGIIDGIGMAIPVTDNSAESKTSAEGKVFGSAESARKSDPISASLIASVSVVDMDPVGVGDEDVFDTSLIASASFAADDYGKASGFAEGTTASSGDMSVEYVHDLVSGASMVANLSSDTNATGTAASNVAVQNGFGVAVSAFGSMNDIDFEPTVPMAEVDDTSFMVNYAAGQGKQVTSSANSIKADTTSTGTFEHVNQGVENVDLDSETQVTGSGSANVQVSGGHQAEALSFMFADQMDLLPPDSTDTVTNAFTAFGVELTGCNDAPVTSTASLSDGNLLADADADVPAGDFGAHSEFTGIDAFAQLKSKQNLATLTVADSVPDLSYAPAGGADVDTYFLLADTNSQPNTVTYFRYGEAVSDQANLFVPDLQVLPILPYV